MHSGHLPLVLLLLLLQLFLRLLFLPFSLLLHLLSHSTLHLIVLVCLIAVTPLGLSTQAAALRTNTSSSFREVCAVGGERGT